MSGSSNPSTIAYPWIEPTDMEVTIGGLQGFGDLAVDSNISQLIATGRVSLYMHWAAMLEATNSAWYFPGFDAFGDAPEILLNFSGTGSGVAEMNIPTVGNTTQPSDPLTYFINLYQDVYIDNGFVPIEVNVNLLTYTTPDSFSDFVNFVTAGQSFGIQNFAPIFSPNDPTWDLNSFLDPTWSYIREEALYGGGLALDAPPALFNNYGTNTAAYEAFTAQEIQWANSNGLRSSVIISPDGDGTQFLNDTQQMIDELVSLGAVPTQWDVENYDVSVPSDYPNYIGSEDQPNTVANVALWVAQNAPITTYTFSPTGSWDGSTTTASNGATLETVSTAGTPTFYYTADPDIGSGPDTLSLILSEDAWLGDAEFTIAVDGIAIGDTQTINAQQRLGQSETLDIQGTFSGLTQTVEIDLLNYAYGGSPTTERDLYVLNATFDGAEVPVSLDLVALGQQSFSFTVPTVQLSGQQPNEGGPPCFCRGTQILTDGGYVAIEELRIGTLLVTFSGERRPIKWIGKRSYNGRFTSRNTSILPIMIRKEALGIDMPFRDLYVSPLHAMYFEGLLVPAIALLSGESILQLKKVEFLEYFHVELSSHDIIFAEGAPAETFIDDHSRCMFQNAKEFSEIYPNELADKVGYCAPRLNQGEPLRLIRSRIAHRYNMMEEKNPQNTPKELVGFLDCISQNLIYGWACNKSQFNEKIKVQILNNGVTLGEIVADRLRPDLKIAGFGDGKHGFQFEVQGGLDPYSENRIDARFVLNDLPLQNSPQTIEASKISAATLAPVTFKPGGYGNIDVATRQGIAGWAQDSLQPEAPADLQILDNGVLLARILANSYREDLYHAGIGNGYHSFHLLIPGGLPPLVRHVIQVKRHRDGVDIAEPVVIEPSNSFDAELELATSKAVASVADPHDHERLIRFFALQLDLLRQKYADITGNRIDRLLIDDSQKRYAAGFHRTKNQTELRALVIDERFPCVSRDAGSKAIVSHMRGLQSLGYEVIFAASETLTPTKSQVSLLSEYGITCLTTPFCSSIEEVLRQQIGLVDLIYLHRVGVATRYVGLTRSCFPHARLIYSVADLHNLRLERQAGVEESSATLERSRQIRRLEYITATIVDAVITHSSTEANILRQEVPEAEVHVVPWEVTVRTTQIPFSQRHGVAFIGNFSHDPNSDAAYWLIDELMQMVWQNDPTIICYIIGKDIPKRLDHVADSRIRVVGEVSDLMTHVFNIVRLTVAPLRFGAGVKGKVLDSFAAGLPCVMTEIASEGIPLSPTLFNLVGRTASEISRLIYRLHSNEVVNREASQAGVSLIRRKFNYSAVLSALKDAVEGDHFSGERRSEAPSPNREEKSLANVDVP